MYYALKKILIHDQYEIIQKFMHKSIIHGRKLCYKSSVPLKPQRKQGGLGKLKECSDIWNWCRRKKVEASYQVESVIFYKESEAQNY